MSELVGTHGTVRPVCDPDTRITRSLLGYGVLAGPSYVLLALIQAMIRPGFDLTRDDVSLLSNGTLGWIQVANFLITGSMVIAFALGVRRALRSGTAATAGPILLTVYGAGLIAAGIFAADPMNGFPAGAPAGRPVSVSLHGSLHVAAAGIGFACLVAACFIIARRFGRTGSRTLARWSRVTGAAFALGLIALASGSSSSLVVLGFWIALVLVWGWMAAVAVRLYRAPLPADVN